MVSRLQVESVRSHADLCKLAEMLGYGGFPNQLQNNNGSFVSSLTNFFEDNPGAIDAVTDWITENMGIEEENMGEEDDDDD